MRPFFLLFIALATAASFTPSASVEGVNVSDFPYYRGDFTLLSVIINLSGSVAREFPRHATCMDELLTDEHIHSLIQALYELEPVDHSRLGWYLRELSPQRFDSICSQLEGGSVSLGELINGYPNLESQWKQSSLMGTGALVTAKNAAYSLTSSVEVCNFMKDRPAEILHEKVLKVCIAIWLNSGEYHVVRKLVWETKNLNRLDSAPYQAFVGHEAEFVEWFKVAMLDGRLQKLHLLQLPASLQLSPEQWEELKAFLREGQFSSIPKLYSPYSVMLEAWKDFNQFVDSNALYSAGFSSSGFDFGPYLGKNPAMAKSVVNNAETNKLVKGYPMQLNDAFGIALSHGICEPLENTIHLLFSVDSEPRRTITEAFWLWYYTFDYEFGIQVDRMRALMSIVKPYLTEIFLPDEVDSDTTYSIGDDSDIRWHFLPLYLDMQANMDAYWPKDLKHSEYDLDISTWVKERIEAIPTDKESLLERKRDYEGDDYFNYALVQGWTEIAKERRWDKLSLMLNHRIISILTNLHGLAHFKRDFADHILASLHDNLGPIALTSAYELLDDYLDLYPPQFILDQCTRPDLKRRIALMLHLSHKTQSYLNGKPMEKNSLFFRDWVYYRLWTKNSADKKLIDYFHENRIVYRRYYGADPVGFARVLGLHGTYQDTPDPQRTEALSFAPQNEESTDVKVEEVMAEIADGEECERKELKRPRPDNEDSEDAEEGEPKEKKPRHS